jgi:hypothetical protein
MELLTVAGQSSHNFWQYFHSTNICILSFCCIPVSNRKKTQEGVMILATEMQYRFADCGKQRCQTHHLASSWTAMTSCHSWLPYWLHGAQNIGRTIFPQFRQYIIIQINLHPEFLLYFCKRQEEDSGRDVMVLATGMQYRFTGAAFHKAFTPKKQLNALASWSREKRGWQRKLRVGKAYLWRSKQRITASSTSSPPSVVSAQVLLYQCLSTGCSLAEFQNNVALQAATAWSWAISRHLVCCPEACRYHTHIIIFHANWKKKRTWYSHYYSFHAEP